MGDIMRKIIKVSLVSILAMAILLIIVNLLIYPFQYVTTDINDYGKYIGNSYNKTPRKVITSFFPEKIEPYFADANYSYRAERGNTYAFEAYLEFTIESTDTYKEYVSSVTAGLEGTPFPYDSSYIAYSIGSLILPDDDTFQVGETTHIGFRAADVRMILCSEEKQSIIFVAIGVFEGVDANSQFLSVFFDRFNIDPAEYAKRIQ